MATATEGAFGPWVQRPEPDVVLHGQPFWDGAKKHEFWLMRCQRCGSSYWPFTVCPGHEDIGDFSSMVWEPSSGHGRIFSYVVVHEPADPAFAVDAPYVLAHVELDEGPLFPARIVGSEPSSIKIGAPVQAVYLDIEETGRTFVFFEVDASSKVD